MFALVNVAHNYYFTELDDVRVCVRMTPEILTLRLLLTLTKRTPSLSCSSDRAAHFNGWATTTTNTVEA